MEDRGLPPHLCERDTAARPASDDVCRMAVAQQPSDDTRQRRRPCCAPATLISPCGADHLRVERRSFITSYNPARPPPDPIFIAAVVLTRSSARGRLGQNTMTARPRKPPACITR